jgi:hypothetical protein
MRLPVKLLCFVISFSMLSIVGGCSKLCGDDVTHSATSPDGALRATVIHRDCEMPTLGEYSRIELRRVDAAFWESPLRVAEFRIGSPNIHLRWKSRTKLMVYYPEDLEVHLLESQPWNSITVELVPVLEDEAVAPHTQKS